MISILLSNLISTLQDTQRSTFSGAARFAVANKTVKMVGGEGLSFQGFTIALELYGMFKLVSEATVFVTRFERAFTCNSSGGRPVKATVKTPLQLTKNWENVKRTA